MENSLKLESMTKQNSTFPQNQNWLGLWRKKLGRLGGTLYSPIQNIVLKLRLFGTHPK